MDLTKIIRKTYHYYYQSLFHCNLSTLRIAYCAHAATATIIVESKSPVNKDIKPSNKIKRTMIVDPVRKLKQPQQLFIAILQQKNVFYLK